MNCGVAVNKDETKSETKKIGGQDKITMILISLLLGAIGIHNFMMGKTTKE